MRLILLCFLSSIQVAVVFAQGVSAGKLIRLPELIDNRIPTDFKQFERPVDVWLPPGYTPKKKYPVIYMHDGQMLFDSTITWNKQEWKVDECIAAMMKGYMGQAYSTIVVAIHNRGQYRHAEYFPQRILEFLPDTLRERFVKEELKGKALADDYLSYLVYCVKPYIDKNFSTKPDYSSTAIAGSSMGGLISVYALMEYPHIFSSAACLSTHWLGSSRRLIPELPEALITYIKYHRGITEGHTLYMSHGTEGLDSLYGKYQNQVDNIFEAREVVKNRRRGLNYASDIIEGGEHNERSWSAQMPTVIRARNRSTFWK